MPSSASLQGSLVTRLRLPSFIVTLAGLLIFNGVLLIVLAFGPFSGYPSLLGRTSNLHALYDLMWGHVTPLVGWIAMVVIVGLLSANLYLRDSRRRRSGLVAPPIALTLIKIVFMAAIGAAVVLVCNVNRAAIGTLEGVPWAIFIVLGVLGAWTFLLQRTRYGRYIYAIGGNPEAARRAGINVAMIRTWAFVLCAMTAGIAGLLYASYLGGMSNNVNGGQLVLYAVAAAVIGGTSLFGGRGRGRPRRARRPRDRRHLQRDVPPRVGRAVGVHRHRRRAHRGGDHRRRVAARYHQGRGLTRGT